MMVPADRTADAKPRWDFPLRLGSFIISSLCLVVLAWTIFYSGDDGPDLPHEGKMGQEVTDGHLIYRLTGLRCGLSTVPGAPRDKPENGQFCELTLEVRNPSDGAERWGPSLSAGSALYYAKWFLGEHSGRSLSGKIAPGERQSGTVLFDISRNAEPLQVQVGLTGYDVHEATIFL